MYAQALRSFFGDPAAFSGQYAFTTRAIGNISRPYFPDGALGHPPGPLSRPISDFNPFSTGLQSALVENDIRPMWGLSWGPAPTRRKPVPATRASQRNPDLPGFGSNLPGLAADRRHRRLRRRH